MDTLELSELKKNLLKVKEATLANSKKLFFTEMTTGLRPRESEEDLNKIVFLGLLQAGNVPKTIQHAYMILFNFNIIETKPLRPLGEDLFPRRLGKPANKPEVTK